MIQKVFGLYDLKACAYLQPFFSSNAGSAIRALEDAVKDPQSPIARHPSDYQLFEIGTFDDNLGSLNALLPVKLLCVASDFVVEKRPLEVPVPVQLDWKDNQLEAFVKDGKKSS